MLWQYKDGSPQYALDLDVQAEMAASWAKIIEKHCGK